MISEETLRVYNKTLEPNIWDKNQKLKPDVRLKLLKIAKDFYKSTDFTSPIIDILLLGSSINYNWTPDSDIDIHIVIDIKEEKLDTTHFRTFFDSLGSKWNKEHDIKIEGHPVEVYIQDITEKNSTVDKLREHASMFSLLKNEWLVPPVYKKISLDKDTIKEKFYELKNKIDKVIQDGDVDALKELMKYIRSYRNKGLEGKDGEFSTENIVFKALRHTGILEKLKNSVNDLYDKTVSIEESQKYLKSVVIMDENRLNEILNQTILELEENDKSYFIIGSIDDNLKINVIKQGKVENYVSSEESLNPSVQWNYFSDVNELGFKDHPSEEQKTAVKDYLLKNHKIIDPIVVKFEKIEQDMRDFDQLGYTHKEY